MKTPIQYVPQLVTYQSTCKWQRLHGSRTRAF